MALSSIVSMPAAARSLSKSILQPSVGSMPYSVILPLLSRTEHAENLMPQPIGIYDVNGIPEPPPVLSPAIITCGNDFITDTKLFAALNVERFVSTTTGFPHIILPVGAGSI